MALGKIFFLSFSLLLASSQHVFPHPGSLDNNGGHYDRIGGKYHCPRPPCSSVEPPNQNTGNRAGFENGLRKVIKAIDGDTLRLSPKEEVRLIGVDTPETKHPKKSVGCFGPQASEFTKKMVEGKKVRLELDEVNTRLGHKDKYGRTLGYVYLEDGTFLNEEIIRQGYGKTTTFRFSHRDEFKALEREAKEGRRGLWSACN